MNNNATMSLRAMRRVLKCFQIHKIIGFAPTLLQVVMSNEVDMPVRQAGKYLLFVA